MAGEKARRSSFVSSSSPGLRGSVTFRLAPYWRLDLAQLALFEAPEEAAAIAHMACGGASLVRKHYHRIVVAVDANLVDDQLVARRFAFHPQLLPGAAPERNEACIERLAPRLLVHEAQHQDVARRG